MMTAELRYLREYLSIFAVLVAPFVVLIAIGRVAQLGAIATTVVVLAVGSATLVGISVFFIRRQPRAGTRGVSSSAKNARYLPLLVDVVLLGWFTYALATMFVALHERMHVSRDSAIMNCCFFVSWLLYTIRDGRDRFPSVRLLPSRGFRRDN